MTTPPITAEQRREAYAVVMAAMLDDIRAQETLTQAALARRLETDRATVCRLLQGRDIHVSTLLWFLDVVGYELKFSPKSAVSDTAA